MGNKKKNGTQRRFTKPKHWETGSFINDRGLALHFGRLARHDKPLAHIVFVAGLSEPTEKTYELARNFNNQACNFSTFDRPGQGRSPRLLADHFKQHSTGMQHSVDDLLAFCDKHVPPGEPIILMGHSTGGLIALEAMLQKPGMFKGAIMTAPLYGFKEPLLQGRESLVARMRLPQSVQEYYIPGGGPWRPRKEGIAGKYEKDFSSDPVRNKIHDALMTRHPELRTGSPTVGWVLHKAKAIVAVRDPQRLKALQKPVYIFTAADDHLVDNRAAREIARSLPRGYYHEYKAARHELLMEQNHIRSDLLYKKALPFIKNAV